MKTPKDLTGQKFGRLTAVALHHERVMLGDKSNGAQWICTCDCGNTIIAKTSKLTSGRKDHCGCLTKQRHRKRAVIHDKSHSTEYSIWTNMKTRCYNPNNKWYHRYGGRGIIMCDRWQSFENFLADMGVRPGAEYTVDRIDNNGIYEKSNCRWATYQVQQNNRSDNTRISYFGVSMTLAEAGRISHLKESTIRRRLKLGWGINDAMSQPTKKDEKGMI